MPPPRMPSEKTATKLQTLPTDKLIDVLDALAKGDLEAAAQAGGGRVSPRELAGFQPDGETGALLDDLEKRAVFLLVRRLGFAVLKALPGAVESLRGISADVGNHGDAATWCEENDKQAQALRLVQAQMRPKVIEQRRIAALALFTLAQDLGILALAKAYRAPDIEADEEAELQRMAAAQGLAYLPPLHTLITIEQPLRRVK